jgi:Uma2 family endonuclease
MAIQAVIPRTEEQRIRMTYDEYLAWQDEDVRSEWVDEEAIVFMGATIRHLLVVGFLHGLLLNYLGLRQIGLVFVERLDVQAPGHGPIRQPDIAVVLNEHLNQLTRTRLIGPADLIIEVVSDESEERDRRDKLEAYAELGVPEYWIVDGRPDQASVQGFELGPDGRYRPIASEQGDRLCSKILPGFLLDPAWFSEDPLPPIAWALEEIAGNAHDELARQAHQERAARGGATS